MVYEGTPIFPQLPCSYVRCKAGVILCGGAAPAPPHDLYKSHYAAKPHSLPPAASQPTICHGWG